MEGAGNQPQNENPPSLFVGNIAPSTSISAASPLENNQDASTISQSGWTSSKATFRKYYLIPSLLFSVPAHLAVLGAVFDMYGIEEAGIMMWLISPFVAAVTLIIFLTAGISKKNKSIVNAVVAGVITDTVVWFGSIYYYLIFAGGF
jgi:hypothetical protein